MKKPLTTKQRQTMIELSKENEALGHFYYQGHNCILVGTFRNKNGSWSHRVKFTDLPRTGKRFSSIGDVELQKILSVARA